LNCIVSPSVGGAGSNENSATGVSFGTGVSVGVGVAVGVFVDVAERVGEFVDVAVGEISGLSKYAHVACELLPSGVTEYRRVTGVAGRLMTLTGIQPLST
jgi:hypothetical protein